ncbi:MAG: energy-coupling factor transporter transmembrane component T [Lachnospiraceae bacterium]
MEHTILQIIMKKQYSGTALLDPRCKLLLLILIGFVSYFLMGDVAGISLMVAFAAFISAGSELKWAVKMLIVYIAVAYLNVLFRYVSVPGLSVMMSVFGVTVRKMIPIIMMGRWVLKTTGMDELMVSLQRMKLPQSVTIPLVVMFRYLPTLRIEYRMIRNAMGIRGIGDTVWKRVFHPLMTMEYLLIPLLMRCLKVTDELAASGTTRGLERDVKRHAIHPVVFAMKEYVVAAGVILFLSVLLLFDHTSIGKIILWRV